jgi:radical SAM superfamily enzyme YgiQ (UPF0313 family)
VSATLTQKIHSENVPQVVLISTYDLGHQPFGLASPAAWLSAAGVTVRCFDLAVEQLDEDTVRAARMVAVYVPMHTATRMAAQVIPHVRKLNPDAHVAAYGLYAPMNRDFLSSIGADSVIGGEFEEPLRELAEQVALRREDITGRNVVSLGRQLFMVPDRTQLPSLTRYAGLRMPDGARRTAGYTEASRGCKHLCRHCPIVPVYGGRFRVVQRDVVLADIAQQIAVGAEHITFGDPDFFNGPAHALAVVRQLHDMFPELSYDVTIKIEHLVKYGRYLPILRDTGCVLITSAVEAFDQRILEILDKRHTLEDFGEAIRELRKAGIAINPTFVAFTPWTSLKVYIEVLATIHHYGLVGNVAPVQYAIRLLLPEGSRLLELRDIDPYLRGFDPDALCYRWAHPDPAIDELQRRLLVTAADAAAQRLPRREVFRSICAEVATFADSGQQERLAALRQVTDVEEVPHLTEQWYCCAEPVEQVSAPVM